MHRFEGHWWSQDEQFLIYTKVDEAAVEVSHRLEIDANGSRQIAQRYPFAGADNPQVRLCRFDIRTQQHVDIWQDDPPAVYLARAGVYNNQIVIQTQDRLQQHLWVQRFDTHSHSWSTVHSETSTSWINLTDDLFALAPDRWLFSSEQDGQRKLVIIGDQLRTLNGPAHINHVHGHDETYAYANGWDDTPTENHLYKIRLDGSGFETLTRSPGWHEVAVNTEKGVFIDRWSSIHEPVNMTLNTLDGHSSDAIYGDPINDNHPYFPFRTQHAVAQFGELSAADGQTLHYRLTPPQDIRGRHPIVLYVYGGPGAQKVKNEWSPLLLQMFASHGFGVLELDNRGATNRGRHFEAPIYRQLGQVEVSDQVAGLGVLTEYDWVDTDRIGVFGHSYGGYMTLMCLCQAPHKFSCGVAVAPVSDWHLYDSHYTERYMGMPHDNVEGYARANVLNHLDKLEAPLLLMHGMADDNVLFTHSTQIMSKLQSLKQTV